MKINAINTTFLANAKQGDVIWYPAVNGYYMVTTKTSTHPDTAVINLATGAYALLSPKSEVIIYPNASLVLE